MVEIPPYHTAETWKIAQEREAALVVPEFPKTVDGKVIVTASGKSEEDLAAEHEEQKK